MDNLTGKMLWVMRHGRPDVPPNPLLMTKNEFNEYLHQYDLAGLSSGERERLVALYRDYPLPDLVISSDLPRAHETAEVFGRGAKLLVDPLFREIPIRIPDASTWFLNRRWPSEFWWSYLRSAWFFDIPPEGHRASTRRSREAVIAIHQHQQQVKKLAVVSHSGFLLVTINQMVRQHLVAGRRLPRIAFGEPTEYRWH